MTVSEALLNITELTKKNVELLEMINNSFYTRANHLSTTIDGKNYVIPSYIALENKVNHLLDGFNNLVHAAKSGEAWFNFDGNSKVLYVDGYQQAPSPVDLSPVTNFGTESIAMFKDMVSPKPYLDFDMDNIPMNITQVNVKKIIPYNETLKGSFDIASKESNGVLSWADCAMILNSGDPEYIKGKDYDEYDAVYDLPVLKTTYSGNYIVEKVVKDYIDEDLNNMLIVQIHPDTPLDIVDFDGAFTKSLEVTMDGQNQYLTTYDGSAKLEIRDINVSKRQLTLKVIHGEYVNVHGYEGEDTKNAPDSSRLRYYPDLVNGKRTLHLTLEEDKYIYVTIAPVNSRLGIQTAWGKGVYINTYDLIHSDTQVKFGEFYMNNVNNIGDALNELTSVMYPSITKYTGNNFENMVHTKPSLSTDTIQVVQINKHINDADAIKTIRSLYSQKKQFQTQLNEIQNKITTLNEELSQISFDDLTGVRAAYEAQLTDLRAQQNELTTSISKIVDEISISANEATIPLEDAKFRARGYVDINKYVSEVFGGSSDVTPEIATSLIAGTQTRYRYRNSSNPQANVNVINEFLFTEWVTYNPPMRPRNMEYNDGNFNIYYSDVSDGKLNSTSNEEKFNQIDIPISQGEIVEAQSRIVWGFGYPFVTIATEWSDVCEITFPEELVKDVQITTIIDENNSDIERLRFDNILSNKGIIEHVDDFLQDQDIKYYHKAEDIASGFYTTERRVIPLRDKLSEMDKNVAEIMSLIKGTESDALEVYAIINGVDSQIQPDIKNPVSLPAYNSMEDGSYSGTTYKENGVMRCTITIELRNSSSTTMRLFSMFPGARDTYLSDIGDKYGLYDVDPFRGDVKLYSLSNGSNLNDNASGGEPPVSNDPSAKSNRSYEEVSQSLNQFIYFRNNAPWGVVDFKNNPDLVVMPTIQTRYELCLSGDSVRGNLLLGPGESQKVYITAEWGDTVKDNQLQHHVMFNVRTSLYTDPMFFDILLTASNEAALNDLVAVEKQRVRTLERYNTTVR